ncbi:DNA translocase FtsK [Streptomyces mirabilis]|jgi:hypothetical protein|uniref:DNA translocase FtsK n=1 Tax=Streptomyces TaxID=1883 RepID=UPI000BD2D788|nr:MULTISPECIES: DNA translocase FtsK [unclassified Streptomyces]SOE19211.1 Ftsk gamma domain-containing protein [Streptomyces sp. OK228]
MAFKVDSGQYTRYFAREFTAQQASTGPAPAGLVLAEGLDGALVLQAVELLVSTQFGSASMLHRKLRIGFALTEKLLDFLHQLDIVGPSDGSKARKMRVSADDQEAVMMKLAVAVEGPVCQQEHLWGQPGQQPGALDGLTGGRTEGRTGQAACVGLTQHGQP